MSEPNTSSIAKSANNAIQTASKVAEAVGDKASKVAEAVGDKASKVAEAVGDAASKVSGTVGDKAADVIEKQKWQESLLTVFKESWIVLLIILCMIVLVFIVIYIFFVIKKNHLQKVVLHKDVITLHNRSVVPYVVSNSSASLTTINGQEFSYSLWIFLSSNYDQTNLHKVILQRGNASEAVDQYSNSTNPLIAMDRVNNTMYVAVSTTKVISQTNTIEEIFNKTDNKFTSGYLITEIGYVPLQRWVNVIVVVKDVNMYIYLDGDIYSITSVNDLMSTVNDTLTRYVIRGTTGDIKIGDSKNPTPGYLSFTQFFNYALNQKDVTAIYKNGPSKKSWLAFLGLGNYGVQSPIYKIN
jgi:hypothetical protein